MKIPIFLASRALIKNRLDESSNLAHRGMYAKFQLIWMISLVRAMGGLKIDFSSYNWRTSVLQSPEEGVAETRGMRLAVLARGGGRGPLARTARILGGVRFGRRRLRPARPIPHPIADFTAAAAVRRLRRIG